MCRKNEIQKGGVRKMRFPIHEGCVEKIKIHEGGVERMSFQKSKKSKKGEWQVATPFCYVKKLTKF